MLFSFTLLTSKNSWYEIEHFKNHLRDDLYAIGMNEETTKKWSLDNNGKYIQVSHWSIEWQNR